ncbi:amino acid adenylation domain-containing protein [Oculatella sp. LEGE 06141]|uniref:non-ribosomal peptide synthetase n=1 Tax=Oculatella sp. LEGE 06141 TaxID=1828648 RepID=UPI0018802B14|nr:non-ribosomal peptide synthetase [Oculatella sp. LEGE 06141]MBE9178538.1 amino acid adenylation domain-containing protein [Oculatella sp. LEGE 06141]
MMNEFAKRIAALSPAQRALLERQLQQQGVASAKPQPIPRRNDTPPLSFAQQRLWFLDQFQSQSPEYNVSAAMRLKGSLNIAALEQALNEMVRRHDVLRTTFPAVDGHPVQAIVPTLTLPLLLVDLHTIPAAQRDAEVQRLARAEVRCPFNLSQRPPMRTALLSWGEDEYWLLVTLHHIIADGWCRGIFIRELTVLYQAFVQGQPSPLDELPIQYGDFAHWQRQQLQGEALERQLIYWRQCLHNSPALLNVPTDRPRPARQTFKGTRQFFEIPAPLVELLKALSQQHGVTLFMTLLAAFQTLLYRYTGQTDILVGSPIANRTPAETEAIIGFFANTLVFRTDLSGNPSFETLLRRVQAIALDAYAHQDVPFEKLVEDLHPDRNLSHNPLFQVMLTLQGVPLTTVEMAGLTLEPLLIDSGTARFDLMLNLSETLSGIRGICEYNTDLFDASTIARLLGHFHVLLKGIAANPRRCVSELPLLMEAETRQILVEWNQTTREYNDRRCIHHRIEAQVEQTPEAIALSFDDQQLTYRELNHRANQLAHYLQAQGVQPDTLVGLCLERSLEMVIGILGVLKAGGAYLPLDPTYPVERLAWMLEDAQVPLLLTQAPLVSTLPPHAAQVVYLDRDWQAIAPFPTMNPPGLSQPHHLAYVIYTSGSTGRPKGVMNTHQGLWNRLVWMQEAYGLTPADRVLQKTPFSFDVSVWEFLWPLMAGARLAIAQPDGHRDSTYLVRVIAQEQVTTLHFVPSMLHAFLDALGLETCQSITRVICSGEALPGDLQTRFFERVNAELHNLYGPTEAAIDVTAWVCQPQGTLTSVPIGRPIANTQIYLLDNAGNPVPIGVPGELHIGGAGLARGYLNRPDLTAEKFIPNPFCGAEVSSDLQSLCFQSSRLYKTGDLARYLPNGAIEFLGRIDHQVKIRGFRIELGEIEAVLNQHPAVKASVVIDYDRQGDRRLVAYVQSSHEITAAELRLHLQKTLPEYMVPAVFTVMMALPLMPNGKVDRRSLPDPDWRSAEVAFTSPRTPVEELLAGIWARVLGLETVSVHDNFFELGGHSLLATQVIAQIQRTFQVELPLRSLFELPTIATLAPAIATALKEATHAVPSIQPISRTQPLPISFAQQRLWFLAQWEPDSPFYSLPAAIRLSGSLDISALHRSFQEIVQRHEVLRTHIRADQGQPLVEISPTAELPLPLIDLSDIPATTQTKVVQQLAHAYAQQTFDLATDELLRVQLLKLSDTRTAQAGQRYYVLLISMHHIAADGWSIGVLLRELTVLYEAYLNGQTSPLPILPIQYVDVAAWQRQWLQGDVLNTQLNYWQQQLAGAPPVLALPTDYPRPPVQTFQGSSHSFTLPGDVTDALRTLSRTQGCTLFMTLLTGFVLLLHRYSNSNDIVVGSPIANRTHPDVEELIGFFVNTLVLRTDVSGNPTGQELLQRVRGMALGAYAHQDLPFEHLVEVLHPDRDLSHTPLFQVMFVLQTPRQSLTLPGLEVQPIEIDRPIAKFDLTLSITETPIGLTARLEYRTDLFTIDTIRRMAGHLQTLWAALAANPDRPIGDLPLLTASEQQQWMQWNRTQSPLTQDGTFIDWFERQVERSPDAVAVVFADQQITYRELNTRANQLAHHLQQRGVAPDGLVGLCVERSIELVIGLLGILKAGGAYVPLDPTYPAARLSYILNDAQVAVLLIQQRLLPMLTTETLQADIVCLGAEDEAIAQQPTDFPRIECKPDHLAYVIYTSGSTGNPKGTLVTHRGLANYLDWCTHTYTVEQGTGTLVHSSIAFDLTVTGLFSPLLVGQRVELVPEDLGIEALGMALRQRSQLSLVKITPAQLQLLAEQLNPSDVAHCTNAFIIGGETLLPEHIAFWQQHAPATRLVNEYGPTETVVGCCVYSVPQGASYPGVVPIGRAIANTDLYVLDQHYQLVPSGVVGELYIGGAGLARGYLHRPDLTAEKFIPHPFSQEPGARLYKTGDLARYRPDGTLECLDRVDHQVKIRGFRIELGEIETALSQYPGIQHAVVLAQDAPGGGKQLVAYIVARNAPSSVEVRRWLKATLPDYMVPTAVVPLEALPLTPNGKVDRRRLPSLAGVQVPSTPEADLVMAPHTPAEEILVGIWQRVLELEAIHVHDNFFELGGHSLLATRVVSHIRQAFRVEVPLRHIFEYPSIAELAPAIDTLLKTEPKTTAPLQPRDRTQPLPLSFAQQRLWFLAQLEPDSPFYNVPVAVRVQGVLNVAVLRRSLEAIIDRHEVLRTAFERVEGHPVPVVSTAIALPLPLIDLQDVSSVQQAIEVNRWAQVEAQQPVPLDCSPLLRVKLIRLQAQEHVLLLTLHHLVADGWSMGVLVHELADFYKAFCQGQATSLPDLPIQYADFAAWQREELEGDRLESQLAYWTRQLAGAAPLLELPCDHPRPAVQTFQGATYAFQISPQQTQTLKRFSQQQGCTLFMTLLTAFQVLLSRYSSSEDIVVGSPIANRNRAETEALIGFFVNTLVLRTNLSGNPTVQEALHRVREVALGAYAHQDLPFERLVEALQPERNLSHTPLFQVMFILQNAPAAALQLPGLTLSLLESQTQSAKFDLTLSLQERADVLVGTLEYNRALFDANTIARMAVHWQQLLEGMMANPHQRIGELDLLTPAEHQQIQAWNAAEADFLSLSLCLHEWVEAQVAKTPDAVALCFEEQQLTYRELDRRANQVAHHLRGVGVRPGQLVGVCLERSPHLVIALLAVLKAGGTYVPLDPSYPPQRLAFILEDADVAVLLTEHLETEPRLPTHIPNVSLDGDRATIDQACTDPLPGLATPDALAYVIYTSGSTGKPKGVQIPHRAVVNFLQSLQQTPGLTSQDVLLSLTTIAFDIAALELFLPLVTGARVVLTSRAIAADGTQLANLMTQVQATVMQATPATWQLLITAGWQGDRCLKLLCGGEALPRSLANALLERCGTLWNMYGPTETTIWSAVHPVKAAQSQESDVEPADAHMPVPIGRAIANTQFYVLNRYHQAVPVGVPGELHIGGAGLAWGYLNRPDLTAEKFIPNPFWQAEGHSTPHSSNLYKTGDRVRYRPDGTLEFLGRIDYQVKVRGFRIELGEIETQLIQHSAIREAVVVARPIADSQELVAYVVFHAQASLESGELRQFLSQTLPAYMVPSVYVRLDNLPLTPNGKVDRQALPAPQHDTRLSSATTYVAPRNQLEQMVAQVWQHILQVETVGIHDNFFDLGGHSLWLVQVHSQLQHRSGTEFPLLELFRYPTVSSLAAFLSSHHHASVSDGEMGGDRTAQLQQGKARLQRFRTLNQLSR